MKKEDGNNDRRRRIEISFKEYDKYHVHINPTPIP